MRELKMLVMETKAEKLRKSQILSNERECCVHLTLSATGQRRTHYYYYYSVSKMLRALKPIYVSEINATLSISLKSVGRCRSLC